MNLQLDLLECSACGGNHNALKFIPIDNEPNATHYCICPVTKERHFMNVLGIPGMWERFLAKVDKE